MSAYLEGMRKGREARAAHADVLPAPGRTLLEMFRDGDAAPDERGILRPVAKGDKRDLGARIIAA
jgi:hypothetical protein